MLIFITGPIRNLDQTKLHKVKANEVRPMIMGDFQNALTQIRPSVSKESLKDYVEWNNTFGSKAS
jgi:fidgetin-like protein 1